MAHPLFRAFPLAAMMVLAAVPGCEKQTSTGGDPTVDGIRQTALPEPDLSILQAPKGATPVRTPTPAASTTATATATGTAPESGPATTVAPESAPATGPESQPATTPAAPTQPVTAPAPAGG